MGNNFGVKDILRIIKVSKKTLFEKYGVTDIAVFGSYARHEHREKSDIGILTVRAEGGQNFIFLMFMLLLRANCVI